MLANVLGGWDVELHGRFSGSKEHPLDMLHFSPPGRSILPAR